jgi:integrase
MKRANGEGTIRQRPSGSWEARYIAADGRQHSVYAKTQKEVVSALQDAQKDARGGIRPVSQQLTVGAWLEEWLASNVRPRLRPSTARSYEMVVDVYVKPHIGGVRLARLTPEQITRMLEALSADGHLSPTTVRYAYSVLRIALGRALKAGKVTRNVATLVDPPSRTKHELRPLTGTEVRAFLASVEGDRLEALYVTAIGTGLRQGELFGLKWSDIDLDAGMLTVNRALDRVTRQLGEPKTDRARRTIALPSSVVAALLDHRRRQRVEMLAAGLGWDEERHVFLTPKGTPLDSRNVTHALQARLVAAGLPRQRFHDLRHACATLLLEQGEELAVVSRVLGHADLSTTADVYAHLTRGMLGRAAARMDAVLPVYREVVAEAR